MIAFFLLIISVLGFFGFFGKISHYIFRPVLQINNVVNDTINNSLHIVRTKKSVFRENEELKIQNQNLVNKMLDYSLLQKENEELKSLMGRNTNKENFILVRVLEKPNRSPYDVLVVDGGENLGFTKGQEVFVDTNIPVGYILDVYSNTSNVKLYSSPGETVFAEIEGSNTSVELLGRGGGNFEMSMPREFVIIKGSSVVFPNIMNRVVAIIVDTVSDLRDPMQKVILKSPVNIQELKWVEVKK